MPSSHRLRHLKGLLASLLIAVPAAVPAGRRRRGAGAALRRAGDPGESRSARWLGEERRQPASAGGDLAVWLDLLDPGSRQDLKALLRAPLLRDTSFGQQLLDSWTGSQMLARLGDLLTTPDGRSTTPVLQTTLRRLLERDRRSPPSACCGPCPCSG